MVIVTIILGPKDFLMLKKIGSWIGTTKKYINNIQNEVSNIDIKKIIFRIRKTKKKKIKIFNDDKDSGFINTFS